jgi:hypothetical protein
VSDERRVGDILMRIVITSVARDLLSVSDKKADFVYAVTVRATARSRYHATVRFRPSSKLIAGL